MKLQWKTCMKIGVSVFVLYLLIHYWSLLAGALSGVLRAAVSGCGDCIYSEYSDECL